MPEPTFFFILKAFRFFCFLTSGISSPEKNVPIKLSPVNSIFVWEYDYLSLIDTTMKFWFPNLIYINTSDLLLAF